MDLSHPERPAIRPAYDAIVIGSGLGGLTAGALYAQEGKRVLVLERHLQPGGAATVYRRKGLRVEVGLHELDGLDDGDPKSDLFRRLGLDRALSFCPLPALYAVRHPSLGEELVLPANGDAAADVLIRRFPQHRAAIRRYFRVIGRLSRASSGFIQGRWRRSWWIASLALFPWRLWPLARWDGETLGGFLRRLFGADESIKLALCANLSYYADDPERLALTFFAAAQGSFFRGGGWFVRGGSAELSRHLAAIVRAHGGQVLTRRLVTHILTEGDRAVGVAHEKAPVIARKEAPTGTDRRIVYAPVLFGNAAPGVLADLLPPGKRERFSARYRAAALSTSVWAIYLGLDRPPADFGVREYSTFVLPDWMDALAQMPAGAALLGAPPGGRMPAFVFTDYSRIDSGLSDPGYYLGALCGLDRLDNWSGLDEAAYRVRKGQWLDALLGALDGAFPGIVGAVVYREMATARTVRDYLNTPGGAIYGFAQEPGCSGLRRPGARTPVKGLWLASAFAFPGGGFTGAMLAGEAAARAAAR